MNNYEPESDFRTWGEIARDYQHSIIRSGRFVLPGRLSGVIRRLVRSLVRASPEQFAKIVRYGEAPSDRARMYLPDSRGTRGHAYCCVIHYFKVGARPS